jgi:hypothetical protein
MSDKKIISPFSEQIASIFTSKFSGEHAMLSELQFKALIEKLYLFGSADSPVDIANFTNRKLTLGKQR